MFTLHSPLERRELKPAATDLCAKANATNSAALIKECSLARYGNPAICDRHLCFPNGVWHISKKVVLLSKYLLDRKNRINGQHLPSSVDSPVQIEEIVSNFLIARTRAESRRQQGGTSTMRRLGINSCITVRCPSVDGHQTQKKCH